MDQSITGTAQLVARDYPGYGQPRPEDGEDHWEHVLSTARTGQTVFDLASGHTLYLELLVGGNRKQWINGIRAIPDASPPILSWNSPHSCENPNAGNCLFYPTAEPLTFQLSASSGIYEIERIELRLGDTPATGTNLCTGSPNPCTTQLSGAEAGAYGFAWQAPDEGAYTFWARAKALRSPAIWSDWKKRVIRLGDRPDISLVVEDEDGNTVTDTFNIADPLTLRATTESGDLALVEFHATREGQSAPIVIPVATPTQGHTEFEAQWFAPTGGEYSIVAYAEDEHEVPGTSTAVELFADDGAVHLSQMVIDRRDRDLSQYEIGQWNPWIHLSQQTVANRQRFTSLKAVVRKNGSVVHEAPYCTSQATCDCPSPSCEALSAKEWVPTTTGTYQVSLHAELRNGVPQDSTPKTITVVNRNPSKRAVTLIADAGSSDGATVLTPASAILDSGMDDQSLALRWTLASPGADFLIDRKEVECAAVLDKSEYASGQDCDDFAPTAGVSVDEIYCVGDALEQGAVPNGPACGSSALTHVSSDSFCATPAQCEPSYVLTAAAHTYYGNVVSGDVEVLLTNSTLEGIANLPATVVANETYQNVSVTVRNTGGTTWDHTYKLIPVGDDPWGPAGGVAIPQNVQIETDDTHTFVFSITAPALVSNDSSEPRTLKWRMARINGTRQFGPSFEQTVTLNAPVVPEAVDPLEEALEFDPVADPEVDAPDHDETLGAIAGSPGVSGGAATYEIPILVPPGRRQMQPTVALAYNSRGGNGSTGMGWSLQAGSAIHRCPSNVAQDGMVRAVRFDALDKLCLDGERLVLDLDQKPTEYGLIGAQYRTEVDSGVRVTQLSGTLDAGDLRFEAVARDGTRSIYGRRTPTKPNTPSEAVVMPTLVAGGDVNAMSWLISHRQDIAGNGMDYLYQAGGSGETLLSEITYTHRSDAPEVPARLRRVVFGYEARSDTSTSYIAGYKFEQTQRLQQISTYVGTSLVRQYVLGYSTSEATGRSLLANVKECATGADGLVCREDDEQRTQMAWHQEAPHFELTADTNLNPPGSELHQYLGSFATSVRLYAAADYDGNGARDILWHGPLSDSTTGTRLLTLSPDRALTGIVDISGIFPTGNAGIDPRNRVDFRGRADFDLDGRPELFGLRDGKLSIHFWRGENIGATTVTPFESVYSERWDTDIVVDRMQDIRYVGDVTGDGVPEIVYVSGLGCDENNDPRRVIVRRLASGTPQSFPPGAVSVVDYTSTVLDDDTIMLAQTCTNVGGGSPLTRGEDLERVADFDGDGLVDYWIKDERYSDEYARDGFERHIALGRFTAGTYSIGTPQSMPSLLVSGSTSSQERHPDVPVFWLDINGDGLDDWLYPVAVTVSGEQRGKWALRLNLGGKWSAHQTLSGDTGTGIELCGVPGANSEAACAAAWAPWRLDRIRPMDYDTDGRSEVLVPTSYAARMCTFAYESTDENENCQLGNGQPGTPDNSCAVPYPGEPVVNVNQPSGSGPGCEWVAYCPERMDAGVEGQFEAFGNDKIGIVATRDPCGRIDLSSPPLARNADKFKPLYTSGGTTLDHSSYNLTALKFRETSSGFEIVAEEAGIIAGQSSLEAGEDMYGDGLADLVTKVSCYSGYGSGTQQRRPCGIPISYGTKGVGGSYVEQDTFEEIPPANLDSEFGTTIPFATASVLVNRNVGAADALGDIPHAPDMMWKVTDGLGRKTRWKYSPLGATADRQSTDEPLYTLTGAAREPSQIHFTSSMHVVAEMGTSDGVGLDTERSYRYSYADALYDVNGRGFLGFASITEADVAAGRSTWTAFHQTFPLTGKVSAVITAVHDGLHVASEEALTWRCRPVGDPDEECDEAAAPYQVFLDRKVAKTYHVSAQISETTVPQQQVSESWQVYATPAVGADACSPEAFPDTLATAVSPYGNVTDQTTIIWDTGDAGVEGSKRTKTCERVQSVWVEEAADWWIDGLDLKVTTSAVFEATKGWVETDRKSQTVDVVYNTASLGRLPWKEVLYDGAHPALNPQTTTAEVTTQYAYTAAGQPNSISVSFANPQFDENGNETSRPAETRTTLTDYLDEKGDDYFPVSVTNAVQHVQRIATRATDGQPASATDPNGVKTQYTYDAFGTLIGSSVVPKSGIVLAHPVMIGLDVADATCPTGSAIKRVQAQRGAPSQTTCIDLLGRTRRVSSPLLGGATVKQDTVYDSRGLVTEQTEPYTASSASGKTLLTYDALERQKTKRVTQAAGKFLKTTYDYGGRTTTITVEQEGPQSLCFDLPGLSPPALCSVGAITVKRVQDSQGRFVGTVDANGKVTHFKFDALGNVASIAGVDGVSTTATYNNLGHRISIDDPNQGEWQFLHNAVGELRWQKDQRQTSAGIGATVWQYDPIGRVLSRRSGRTDVDGTGTLRDTLDTFAWDPLNGKGQLHTQTRSYLTPGTTNVAYQERAETSSYDAFGRRTLLQIGQYDGSGTLSLSTEWGFDPINGRLWWQQWNNDEGLWFVYDGQGRHVETRDGRDADNVYWKALSQDAWGRVSQSVLGGVLARNATPVPQTGQISSIAYTAQGVGVQSFDYKYDAFGNVVQQSLNAFGTAVGVSKEDFWYDTLHRLVRAQRSDAATGTVDYRYTANGNIASKNDYGSGGYVYGSTTRGPGNGWAGPNAVRTVSFGSGTRTFGYDPNGNMLTASGGDLLAFSASYDANNQPVRTALDGTTLRFAYGPDGQRARQSGAAPAQNRIYMPGYERTSGETKYYVGDYALITRSATDRQQEYLVTDRLGSIAGVIPTPSTAGSSPTVAEPRGFDPFGKPRDGNWNNAAGDALPSDPATPRGFTAHEHLDGVKLIHMNGRAFDYGLGRFLSVDPFIQFPLNSQGLNPYSYVLNNPLSGTDPTGYKIEDGPCAASRIKGVCDGLPGNMGGRSTQWLPKEKKRGNGNEKAEVTPKQPTSMSDIGSPAVSSTGVQVAQAGKMDHDLLCDLTPHRCEQQKQLDDLRDDIGTAVDIADKVAVTVAEELTSPVNLLGPVGRVVKTGRAVIVLKNGDEVLRVAGSGGQVFVRFGNDANQISHAFRHTDALGLDRAAVQSAIQGDLITAASRVISNKPMNQVIEVSGKKIQYTAYKLDDGTINIGRIHGYP